MIYKCCEISRYPKDNGIDVFFMTETWHGPHGDEAKAVELAPNEFDVKHSHLNCDLKTVELLPYTNPTVTIHYIH